MDAKYFKLSRVMVGLVVASVVATAVGMNLEQQFGTVAGRVTGPDGQPVGEVAIRIVVSGPSRGSAGTDGASKGKSVSIICTNEPILLGKGQSLVAFGKSDANGTYEIKKVPVGNYKIVTNLNARFKAASLGVAVEADKTANVDIKLEAR